MSAKEIVVEEWPRPRGYSNGRLGQGACVHVAGQIGWDENMHFAEGLAAQFGKALDNVLAVVRAAGGGSEDIASMTVFVTDIDEYRRSQAVLAPIWRGKMGKHYPAMALVAVTALVEPQAVVEIQAIAYLEVP
jgi:enamine deaminase RidA (YjgF/YER057c/UK114 family)